MDSRIKFVDFIKIIDFVDFIGPIREKNVFLRPIFSIFSLKTCSIPQTLSTSAGNAAALAMHHKNAKNPKVDKIDKFGLKVLVVHNSLFNIFYTTRSLFNVIIGFFNKFDLNFLDQQKNSLSNVIFWASNMLFCGRKAKNGPFPKQFVSEKYPLCINY